LYHGPMAAVAEAIDGLDKIRMMKYYNDNMRSQICTQIRQAATQVYQLLVDRAKLFSIRRLCLNKRRMMRKPDQGVVSMMLSFSRCCLELLFLTKPFLTMIERFHFHAVCEGYEN
jgi:hypothetical protein